MHTVHAKFLVASIWRMSIYPAGLAILYKMKAAFRFLTPLRSWPMLWQTFFNRSSRPSCFNSNFNYILYMYMRTIAIFVFIHKPPSPLPVFLSGQGELPKRLQQGYTRGLTCLVMRDLSNDVWLSTNTIYTSYWSWQLSSPCQSRQYVSLIKKENHIFLI